MSEANPRCLLTGRDACVRRRAAASHGLPTTVEDEGRDEARGGARDESGGRQVEEVVTADDVVTVEMP